jgi:transposase
MSRHRRDSQQEAFWRKAIGRQAAGSLGVRAFCQRERLSESAFYWWRRSIREQDAAGHSRPAFVPATLSGNSPGGPSFTVELAGGCVLRLAGAEAISQLADLIIALQSKAAR